MEVLAQQVRHERRSLEVNFQIYHYWRSGCAMKGEKMEYELSGAWTARLDNKKEYPLCLPGTLDEYGIGEKDEGKNPWHPDISLGNLGMQAREKHVIATRYTRVCTWEGPVELERRILWDPPAGERIFLEAERARTLRLSVDGVSVPHFRKPCLNTPQIFEVTDQWKPDCTVRLTADNSYPDMPKTAVLNSSAATDETQTNWNGILGVFRLTTQKEIFVENLWVYPYRDTLKVIVELNAQTAWKGELTVTSDALARAETAMVHLRPGRNVWEFSPLPLADGVRRWDEEEGTLCRMTARLSNGSEKTVSFGVRQFGKSQTGRLTLNGRTIFLRGETNCAVFPETGHPPMDRESWEKILGRCRDYGVNVVRFHSWCPPAAAFEAADRMGMMMQPELSHWAPGDAFEQEESYRYYRTELEETLRMLANHPSFVMMTFGNELAASEKGHERMRELLRLARSIDDTRLYAEASNPHYGDAGCEGESDFYTAQKYYGYPLRGTSANMEGYLNHSYPGAKEDYRGSMEELRKAYPGPVFSFEVGQYEVLPDFDELEEFRGVCRPENLGLIWQRVKERRLLPVWKRYVEASGELSRICYREEVEAALRTEEMSGISLLGLQDFPGQGTALVGMMTSHLKPKPYPFARPEAFRAFFCDQLPLAILQKYTYETTETLTARVRIANYGKAAMEGAVVCALSGEDFYWQTELARVCCPPGGLTDAGELCISLEKISKPARLELKISLNGRENLYPVWVYPPVTPVCPEGVYQTEQLDEKARDTLQAGGTVYLSPPSTKEALPASVQAQFTTDFWSVGTFDGQEGCMGQLIDTEHPLFRLFPTEFHTNWQWWPMAVQRAVIVPEDCKAIVTELDSYAWLRPMAQLFECRCGKGRVMFSSMGLQNLQEYPEARTLLAALYRYMDSEEFQPQQEYPLEVLESVIGTK